jgi:hypothetical protein
MSINEDVIRDLQNQIDDYITNYICKRYLADEYYGTDEADEQMPRPNWRDDIIGNNPEDWLNGILAENIDADGRGDYNYWTFHTPNLPNAVYTIFSCVGLAEMHRAQEIIQHYNSLVDNAPLCRTYVSYWLENNLDYLKNKILEYRLERIALENGDE